MHDLLLRNINIMLAPVVGLIIILIDCRKIRYSDSIMRRLMNVFILFTLGTMLSEILYDVFMGSGGSFSRIICWAGNTFYFVFQVAAFALVGLFLDYSTFLDTKRLKRLGMIALLICAADMILLVVNLFTGFIFTISPGNIYLRSEYYYIQLVLSYSLILLILVNTLISRSQMTRSQFVLVLVAVFPAVGGSVLDLIISDIWLIWPCFFLSLLFLYLFVVRVNALIDGLTGVHNRRSCDEYLMELTRLSQRKAYAFIMIDIDKFKEINDTLGHAQGDAALRDMAEILCASVRRTDFVARYGGDEFVVVAATEEPEKIIDCILNNIQDFNTRKTRAYNLEISYGSGLYTPEVAVPPQEFLAHVDGLMYAKKNERRKQTQR